MKYKIKITFIILSLFIVTQFIGLYVINYYIDNDNQLPYGMAPPPIEKESDFYTSFLPSIIIAFIIAISILFLLMKFNAEFILKLWFFLVVVVALGISINAFIPEFKNSSLFILILILPLAFIKIYKRDILVHNATELFVYPGIAAVFVPLLNIWTIIILLVLISFYDMWAVWHSGLMIKMAKYQINKLKVFGGFFVPYISKKTRAMIKKLKKTQLKGKRIKVDIAILGGGDVIFPLIAAGVALKAFGFLPALFVIIGATLGLTFLLFNAEKKKFYPAMPFISAGVFLGLAAGYFLI